MFSTMTAKYINLVCCHLVIDFKIYLCVELLDSLYDPCWCNFLHVQSSTVVCKMFWILMFRFVLVKVLIWWCAKYERSPSWIFCGDVNWGATSDINMGNFICFSYQIINIKHNSMKIRMILYLNWPCYSFFMLTYY